MFKSVYNSEELMILTSSCQTEAYLLAVTRKLPVYCSQFKF